MKRGLFALSLVGVALVGGTARAAGTSMTDAIGRLFTAPALEPAWFAAGELTDVPLDAWRTVLDDLTRALGPYRSVTPNGATSTVAFANGTVQATAALDANGAFTRLLFDRMQSAAVVSRLTALFQTTPVPAAWFSDSTLQLAPIDRLNTMLGAIATQFGAFQKATPARDGTYTVTFAKGALSFSVFLDGDGKIDELRFVPVKAT